jgi:hypothetical protein
MATFGDLEAYLRRAPGWAEEPNLSRGRRRTGDHRRYSKVLPDGSRLRTKVSAHPREEIGEDLFRRILRDQLRVSAQEFWNVVHGHESQPPQRDAAAGSAPPTPGAPGIPGWLVMRLIEEVGMAEADVLAMTPEVALEAWGEHQARAR